MKTSKILKWIIGFSIAVILRIIINPDNMSYKNNILYVVFLSIALMIALMIISIIYKLQRFLSSRRNKYLGLILPFIWLFGTSIAVISNYLDNSNPEHGPIIPNIILLCLLNVFTIFGLIIYKTERTLLKLNSHLKLT